MNDNLIDALRDYQEERPWGYRMPLTERLIELLEGGMEPQEALDEIERDARIADVKVRNHQWGRNTSLQNTLEELREVVRP
ncbi:hypothetical protein [Deinococcus yavapaiensis]|uniref:Uncharacterized protein n=1 Tax=Deinococcus yavapaiensis KR-236 TaxID=694435 RepID=A0A318S8C4_9DEIO|nr:hypothetical protein [Deinococcus yavapaiensis]PYE53293.1 hypothetical protein DES52_10965 [Deinococcus yavapaiensis KR-236]